MHKISLWILLVSFFIASLATAQGYEDIQVQHLTKRILDRLPDAPYTRQALGRGVMRPGRAHQHARAIVAAAREHMSAWRQMAQKAKWVHFKPEKDLAPLIAAMTYRESSFRNIVRRDGGNILTYVPIDKINRKIERADIGVMQVRAPSKPAFQCGVRRSSDIESLLSNIQFAYKVGTCILTNRVKKYALPYKKNNIARLRYKNRPKKDLRFYGVRGSRRGSADAARARELLFIERYNWGGKNLYTHDPNSGYARRVLKEFEFFREGLTDAMYAM